MKDYRYILDRSSKKHQCPQCGKRRFVRYIDTTNGDYAPDEYGRCDRESDCGYHSDIYSSGYAKAVWMQENGNKTEFQHRKPQLQRVIRQEPKPIYFQSETYKECLKHYDQNTFIQNLLSNVPFPFPQDEVVKLIQNYLLGTIADGYRKGAVTFPFIDANGNIRAVQVKQFDDANHTTGTGFLHSLITRENSNPPKWLQEYTQQDKFVSCLFGEHLLKHFPNKTVALVEAPKTAIYCSHYLKENDFIWMAVYNKSSFSFEKLKALKGRTVFIFPDLSKDGGTFQEWKTKAEDFERQLSGTRFIVSDFLERYAPQVDRDNGNDLADFIIKIDWRKFRKQKKYEDYTREERVKFAINYFKTEELQELAKQMFQGSEQMSITEIQNYLSTAEGLQGNDIPDLMDVLCIKKVLKVSEKGWGNYELNFKVQQKQENATETGEKIGDLNQLAELLIPIHDSKTERELISDLCTLKGLSSNDAENLIKEMKLKDIIDTTHFNTYYFPTSTPF